MKILDRFDRYVRDQASGEMASRRESRPVALWALVALILAFLAAVLILG
jgi:hypothetical protein